MELLDLRFYTQEQLIDLANLIAAHLQYENYSKTHLYINGKNAEPELWFDATNWSTNDRILTCAIAFL